jgi:aryl-alcohol dehydrogenase-like predicted oxidoreductase
MNALRRTPSVVSTRDGRSSRGVESHRARALKVPVIVKCARASRVVTARACEGADDDARASDVSRRTLFASTAVAAAAMSTVWLPGDRAAAAAATVPKAASPLLGSEVTPSQVIKGCWQLSGGHSGDRDTDRTSGNAAVDDFAAFVDAGITTFDTGPPACGYGPSELVIGEYLKTPHGKRNGDNIQIFTKMCCVGREQANMTPEWVEANVAERRKRLGVAKVDVIQMYWNEYSLKGYVDAALYLTDLKHKGLIGAVSLTNFDTKRMKEMVDAGAEISSNQIQYSLLDRRPENIMVKYCKENGIGLTPYGVVAGGLLSDRYLNAPPEDVVMNTSSLRKYASVVGQVGGYKWYQSLLQTLRDVGDKHGGVSVANVATKWVLDSPVVPAVILGARNASHIQDHVKLFDFELDGDDRSRIAKVLAEGRSASEDAYAWERGGRW